MRLDSCCAHSMGTLIVEGCHQPFRALACPLHFSAVTITPGSEEQVSLVAGDFLALLGQVGLQASKGSQA